MSTVARLVLADDDDGPDWAVSNEITAIMGGAEDRSTGTQQARNRLVVRGVVIMGGVDIKT